MYHTIFNSLANLCSASISTCIFHTHDWWGVESAVYRIEWEGDTSPPEVYVYFATLKLCQSCGQAISKHSTREQPLPTSPLPPLPPTPLHAVSSDFEWLDLSRWQTGPGKCWFTANGGITRWSKGGGGGGGQCRLMPGHRSAGDYVRLLNQHTMSKFHAKFKLERRRPQQGQSFHIFV